MAEKTINQHGRYLSYLLPLSPGQVVRCSYADSHLPNVRLTLVYTDQGAFCILAVAQGLAGCNRAGPSLRERR